MSTTRFFAPGRAAARVLAGPLIVAAIALAACTVAMPAQAQNDAMTPIEAPAQPDAIELGTGPLAGATVQESWHRQYGSHFARNVTVATLTPFLPDPAKASGAAVLVAPGGGFRVLSMENEGWDVARASAIWGARLACCCSRVGRGAASISSIERCKPPRSAGV